MFTGLLLWGGCPAPTITATAEDSAPRSDTTDTAPATDSAPGDSGPSPTDSAPPTDSGTGRTDTGPHRVCNGLAALCDRPLDRVVFPGTHNSMSNADAGWVVPNQTHGLTRQLEDGIRALLLDTHDFHGEPYLCHANCWLGRQSLVEGLTELRDFLGGHPDEVLVLLIEDHVTAEATEAAFVQVGLDARVYAHPGGTWPTLRTLLDAGTPLVVHAENQGPPPGWYGHAWDSWQDTPYTFWHEDDFTCELNRGSADNPLLLVNHWLSNPVANRWSAEVANGRDILEARVADCEGERGRLPSVLAVDFYEVGDLLAVVTELNAR